jgi:hypothetical protein
MTTSNGAPPSDESVEIGPTDSFDIRGPRPGRFRPKVRFQLTYDFLRLPDGSVHSWQNISDLQLAPDGETLLVWVFAAPSERGERSESDPVSDEPVAVSLRGWPYPPDEIVATLLSQFEKYLAEVAVDDASADDASADDASADDASADGDDLPVARPETKP